MKKIIKAFRAPDKVLIYLLSQTVIGRFFANKTYLRIIYRLRIGKKLNIDSPKSFNEKLQWLKLYDRATEHTMMSDKYLVRSYIKEKIGEEYLIPLIGVWDRPEDIDFNALPDKFVLKCNHNSGLGMCICKDKSKLDFKQVRSELSKGLKQDYYITGREWPYKNIPRKIIAEKYMEDGSGDELKDYKLMCFNGKVKCSFICSDRFLGNGLHVTFFDRNWEVMPFERHYPSLKEGIPRPENYELMVELAEKLSENITFVRVDFYNINGRIYFGELTFYPGSGFEEFTPEKWDRTLGDWITLPD